MDHITKFLGIERKDFILVIQDQFSEMIHLKAMKEKETAAEI